MSETDSSPAASGLDSLHNLTTMTRMNLRVDLRDKDESVYAEYSTFEVAKRNYRLTVGGYSGTAGERKREPTGFVGNVVLKSANMSNWFL